ncbi:MAG: hypothetical protein WAV41_03875 [Microgenomates group bacterium]
MNELNTSEKSLMILNRVMNIRREINIVFDDNQQNLTQDNITEFELLDQIIETNLILPLTQRYSSLNSN